MKARTRFAKAIVILVAVPTWIALGVSAVAQTSLQPTQTFHNVRYLAPFGWQAEPVEVVMTLDADQLILRSARDGSDVKIISFTMIKSAAYSFAKDLPWKPGNGFPYIFFMGPQKHWFTVQGDRDFAVMTLDNRNPRVILSAFENRTGLKVQTLTGN
jgi:hypothetical protein